MKRIDNHFKLLVAIIVVLGLSLSVMAQQSRKGPMHHRSMTAKSGLQYLDLTEEQKDQIKEIHLAHMKDVQSLKDEVKINRVKVDALLKRARHADVNLRWLVRRLQPYIVNIRRYQAPELQASGQIVELFPGLYEWKGNYDNVRGIVSLGLRPEDLVA